jgi:hypothetical protein
MARLRVDAADHRLPDAEAANPDRQPWRLTGHGDQHVDPAGLPHSLQVHASDGRRSAVGHLAVYVIAAGSLFPVGWGAAVDTGHVRIAGELLQKRWFLHKRSLSHRRQSEISSKSVDEPLA